MKQSGNTEQPDKLRIRLSVDLVKPFCNGGADRALRVAKLSGLLPRSERFEYCHR